MNVQYKRIEGELSRPLTEATHSEIVEFLTDATSTTGLVAREVYIAGGDRACRMCNGRAQKWDVITHKPDCPWQMDNDILSA